jgi:DNA (cytosine-5)-methyltransferase 1
MEFPRKVLDYHFPNADSHIDICKTDFKKYANTIDIISGGFPCQPFSLAGKRKGTDDERYLWGEMLRAIQEIKPRFVIAENVFGITNIDGGLVFQQVCLDLENEGYEVQPFIIPAAAKNAPHRRDRCWFIATNSNGSTTGLPRTSGSVESHRGNGHLFTEQRGESSKLNNRLHEFSSNVTNTNGNGFNQCNGNDEINTGQGRINAQCNIESVHNEESIIEHANGIRQERRMHTNKSKIAIGEQFSERNARSTPTTNWENFPTQSPICGGDDGLPTELDRITFSKWRQESIKGYGNAIVPQVAYEIFKVLQDIDDSLK